jgi:predicted HicB family RNase H-like nuclease
MNDTTPPITFTHRGYTGVVTDVEADLISGTVPAMKDVLHFEGRTLAEVRESFQLVVDEYLAMAVEKGFEPDRPKSGRILVRVPPEQHRRIEEAAIAAGKSMNDWIVERLTRDAA